MLCTCMSLHGRNKRNGDRETEVVMGTETQRQSERNRDAWGREIEKLN